MKDDHTDLMSAPLSVTNVVEVMVTRRNRESGIRNAAGDEGVPMVLGDFQVTKAKTGWMLMEGPALQYEGHRASAYVHAFSTWDDLMAWVQAQNRPADSEPG
jgi:hypothetical protein